MSIFSFQPHPNETAHASMSMPTCVTMPNGVIAMFPDVKAAQHAYQEAYPRVGALTSTRTMEYIDLNGAPWTLVLTSTDIGSTETASASSVAYAATCVAGGAKTADSLESDIIKIDNYAKSHERDSLETKNLTHYPQTPFNDSNGHEWTTRWITQKGKGHLGYFGFESDVVVGPAVSKTALKAMVEKYLTRLSDEKSTSESYAITSLAYGIDATRSMDVPPGIPSDGGAGATNRSTSWGNVAIFTGAFALVSYLAYAAWTNLGAQ